jgi:hypothetical protein
MSEIFLILRPQIYRKETTHQDKDAKGISEMVFAWCGGFGVHLTFIIYHLSFNNYIYLLELGEGDIFINTEGSEISHRGHRTDLNHGLTRIKGFHGSFFSQLLSSAIL